MALEEPILACQLESYESGIDFWPEGGDVILNIDYSNIPERAVGAGTHRRLRFKNVVEFHRENFPSPVPEGAPAKQSGSGVAGMLGSVVEFRTSSRADAWSKHFARVGWRFRHYWVAFMEENVSFTVIAVAVSDEGLSEKRA